MWVFPKTEFVEVEHAGKESQVCSLRREIAHLLRFCRLSMEVSYCLLPHRLGINYFISITPNTDTFFYSEVLDVSSKAMMTSAKPWSLGALSILMSETSSPGSLDAH